MNQQLKIGTKIEFQSGLTYEIIKSFGNDIYDIKALTPLFGWMPDFFPVYYSIKIKDYKIIYTTDIP